MMFLMFALSLGEFAPCGPLPKMHVRVIFCKDVLLHGILDVSDQVVLPRAEQHRISVATLLVQD